MKEYDGDIDGQIVGLVALVECGLCHGWGETTELGAPTVKCDACEGAGKVQRILDIDKLVRDALGRITRH